jgi:hypothetical protein
MPRAATSGSTQPEKHDPPATTSAEQPDVAAQPTRAATPRSPAPSTGANAPTAKRARADPAPPGTQTTTANDPPSPDSTKEPTVADPREDEFLNPTAFEIDAKSGVVRYIPLASWGLGTRDASVLKSINDDAVGDDRRVFVISRSSGILARLHSDPRRSETVVIGSVWGVPEEIEHPEGLVLLEGPRPLVADDRPAAAGGPNLFLLSTLSG